MLTGERYLTKSITRQRLGNIYNEVKKELRNSFKKNKVLHNNEAFLKF